MNITRKEFIQSIKDVLEGNGLTLNLKVMTEMVTAIELHMVPKPIPVKVGVRNGLDIVHNVNKFRAVHKKCDEYN